VATKNTSITARSIVAAVRGQLSCVLTGGIVILNLESGVYYGLQEVGVRIWELLKEPAAVRDIEAALQSEYEVESERCQRDVRALLQDLVEEKLVEIRGEAIS
jgi:hypothetical protein